MKQYKVNVLKTGRNLGEFYKYSYKTKDIHKYVAKKFNQAINIQIEKGGKVEIKKAANSMFIDFSQVSGIDFLSISYQWEKIYK